MLPGPRWWSLSYLQGLPWVLQEVPESGCLKAEHPELWAAQAFLMHDPCKHAPKSNAFKVIPFRHHLTFVLIRNGFG